MRRKSKKYLGYRDVIKKAIYKQMRRKLSGRNKIIDSLFLIQDIIKGFRRIFKK